jgi:hypothetical protein
LYPIFLFKETKSLDTGESSTEFLITESHHIKKLILAALRITIENIPLEGEKS